MTARNRENRTENRELHGGGPFTLKAGEWTDDTSMVLCLADSLLACDRLNPHDLMGRFAVASCETKSPLVVCVRPVGSSPTGRLFIRLSAGQKRARGVPISSARRTGSVLNKKRHRALFGRAQVGSSMGVGL